MTVFVAARTACLSVSIGALAALGGAILPAAAQTEIFPSDRLSIRVLEWLPARGEYRDWNALAGDYSVSTAQTIQVPFLGEVSTRERSVAALSDEIAAQLQAEMTLPTKPAVSIQFAERASVFVTGGVQEPGALPFQAGLTVGKAVALAGGYYRDSGGTLRLERDVISAQAAMHLARYQAARSLARMARLESELSDRAEVSDPETVPSIVVPPEMIVEEQRVLDIRRNARESTIETVGNVRRLAEDQLRAVGEKGANIDEQIVSLRTELGGVQSLVDRGLAVAGRGFTLERSLADFEGRRIDLDLALLQAELEIGQTERDILQIRTDFQARALAELQEERSELERSINGLSTAEALLREAAVIAPERVMQRSGNLAVQIEIELTRTVDGVTTTLRAADETPVIPGDILQIQMQRPPETVDLSVLDAAPADLVR